MKKTNFYHGLGRLRREWILLSTAVLICGCIGSFLYIAEEVGDHEYLGLEKRILLAWRQPDHLGEIIGPSWIGGFARDLSGVGSIGVSTLLTVLVIAYLVVDKAFGRALLVLIAVGGGGLLNWLLKHWFERPRPAIVPYLDSTIDASFPSGHTMGSAIIYITLGVLLARATDRPRKRLFFLLTGLLLSFLIGLSRIVLGVHYPSDVAAGWSAGAAWALLCLAGAELVRRRRGTGATAL